MCIRILASDWLPSFTSSTMRVSAPGATLEVTEMVPVALIWGSTIISNVMPSSPEKMV